MRPYALRLKRAHEAPNNTASMTNFCHLLEILVVKKWGAPLVFEGWFRSNVHPKNTVLFCLGWPKKARWLFVASSGSIDSLAWQSAASFTSSGAGAFQHHTITWKVLLVSLTHLLTFYHDFAFNPWVYLPALVHFIMQQCEVGTLDIGPVLLSIALAFGNRNIIVPQKDPSGMIP